MTQIPEEILLAIQQHFHTVIRGRAAKLIDEYELELPQLTFDDSKGWFPIPGMYGGFSYWWKGEGKQAKLITESWCRVVDGSGQRHEITAQRSRLIDEGFM